MVKTSTISRPTEPVFGPTSDRFAPVRALSLPGLTDYEKGILLMEQTVEDLAVSGGAEQLWFVEHPALYTGGTSARSEDLLDSVRFPVFMSGRGGEFTYHGPGQRVVYLMLDMKRRAQDVRGYVRALEAWIIDALALTGVSGERREGRVGIWVRRPDKGDDAEDKIAAIGIRVRKWVTFHGISINVEPDLTHYAGIVPCGIAEHGVTSLRDLGTSVDMAGLDAALLESFPKYFGPVDGDLGPV